MLTQTEESMTVYLKDNEFETEMKLEEAQMYAVTMNEEQRDALRQRVDEALQKDVAYFNNQVNQKRNNILTSSSILLANVVMPAGASNQKQTNIME